MPTYGLYVPETWEFKDDFNSLVETSYEGIESAYLREVVERDLTERRTARADVSPTILVELARELLGKMGARQMQAVTQGVDQAEALTAMLTDYISERNGKQPRARF